MSEVPGTIRGSHTDTEYQLFHLGTDHLRRFQRQRELGEIEKALIYFSLARALSPNNHPNLPHLLTNMGACYGERFKHQGNPDDLEKSIEYKSRAISLTPDDHPDLPRMLLNLQGSHIVRFERLGEQTDVEKALEYASIVVALTPHDHPDLPARLMSLGMSYSNLFQCLGGLDDLEMAIESQSRAVMLTPNDHPDFPPRLNNLGVSYNHRFQRLGHLGDLEKVIECDYYAVSLTPNSHPDLPSMLMNLGAACGERFSRLGQLGDIEKTIEFLSRALSLTPNNDPGLPYRLMNIGVSYSARFQRLGELDDLEKAIELQSRAVTLTLDGHPLLLPCLINLGVSYNHRFKRLGDPSDLKGSINCNSCALSVTSNDHPNLPLILVNLGASYSDLFRHLGELSYLNKAIELQSRALELTPEDHPHLPSRLINLGASYDYRFQRLGNLIDIEKSIEFKSRAFTLAPKGHPELPSILNNLGKSYSDRYKRLNELGDIERAIELQVHSIKLTSEGHPELSSWLTNLGVSYSYRFGHLGEIDDIDKMIECNTRASKMTPNGHPHLPIILMNLGVAYGTRFTGSNDVGDLNKAIETYTRVFALTPNGHPDLPYWLVNFGVAYADRFRCLNKLDDIENANICLLCALDLIPNGHPKIPKYQYALARFRYQYSQRMGDYSLLQDPLKSFRNASQSILGPPKDRYLAALEWASITSKHSPLTDSCIEPYQTAIDLLPHFVWLGATTHQRYQDLDHAKNLAVSAAAAAIRLSELALALEWLEHARCVVWNQSLMLRSPFDELYSSNPTLSARLQMVSNRLREAGSEVRAASGLSSDIVTPEQAAQQHRRLAEEYNDLLTQVREISGFEDFLRPMKAGKLFRAARYGPIVVINCSEEGCDALIVHPGEQNEIKHIPLPGFTIDKAQSARSKTEASVRNRGLKERGKRRPVLESDKKDEFGSMLAILWYDVVKPVLDSLAYMNNPPKGSLPHITWCPTGALSCLPLHAAGDYDQPGSRVFDYVVSSYTPTLTAFLASTPSSFDPGSRVLAVGQEATSGHNSLPGTTQELAYVQSRVKNVAQYTRLLDEEVTISAVLDAMEEHDWVHLACHAHQNVADATQSGFFLHDGILDLATINRRSFKKRGMAFLSACQTATGDKELPDEAIHLASGMLMAGYSSVIGTMWAVYDDDAPLVADRVYAHLMKDKTLGNGEAGKALHDAVAELRIVVGERSFKRWVPYIHIGS